MAFESTQHLKVKADKIQNKGLWTINQERKVWERNIIKILGFRPFQFQEQEKTNSGYKHNNKVSHGIFNLTFRMLQHTSSEVTVTKYDEI